MKLRLKIPGLRVSFLPRLMVRRELTEGRLLEVPFEVFSLPAVATYFISKDMGELEKEFLERIQALYFS